MVADLRQKYLNSWKNTINIIDACKSPWLLRDIFSLGRGYRKTFFYSVICIPRAYPVNVVDLYILYKDPDQAPLAIIQIWIPDQDPGFLIKEKSLEKFRKIPVFFIYLLKRNFC